MEVIMTTKEDLMEFAVAAVNLALEKSGIRETAPSEKNETSHIIRGIKGLAEFLGVSQPTAQRMKNQRLFPCIQHGRTLLFKPDEVLDGLAKNKGKRK